MQQPYVEPPLVRRAVARHEVVRHVAVRKAAPVQGDAQMIEPMHEGFAARKLEDVRRQRDRLADHALGVVVAAHVGERDPGTLQAPDLAGEEQPDRVIGPVSVIDVASHHQEGRPALDRVIDQRRERFAAGRGETLRQRGVAAREPRERLPRCRSAAWMKVKLVMWWKGPERCEPQRSRVPTEAASWSLCATVRAPQPSGERGPVRRWVPPRSGSGRRVPQPEHRYDFAHRRARVGTAERTAVPYRRARERRARHLASGHGPCR